MGREKPWDMGEFYGKSYFCNPRGQIIAQGSRDHDEVIVADLDLDEIHDVRATWQDSNSRPAAWTVVGRGLYLRGILGIPQ